MKCLFDVRFLPFSHPFQNDRPPNLAFALARLTHLKKGRSILIVLGLLLLAGIVTLSLPQPVYAQASVYYVDAVNGSDATGDGSASAPWQTITYALSQVDGPDVEIHVAPGLYDQDLGEGFPITMEPGVSLIGTGRTTTVLSGNGSDYVILFPGLVGFTETTVISGFKITNGSEGVRVYGRRNNYPSPMIQGNWITGNTCGIRNQATSITRVYTKIQDNLISDNTGYGIYNRAGYDSRVNPTIRGNQILDNGSTGVHCYVGYEGACNATFVGNVISNNREWGIGYSHVAGKTYRTSTPEFINNFIAVNTSGGARFQTRDRPTFVNNTIVYNNAYGIRGGTPTIVNSVVWGHDDDLNVSVDQVSFSDVSEAGYAGVNDNISADPQCVDPSHGDCHVLPTSPVLDAGDSTNPSLPATDLDGDPRILGAAVDIGADETITYSVSIAKAVWPTGVTYPGDLLTYTLTLTNLSPVSAGGPLVTDTLPPHTTWTGYAQASTGYVAVHSGTLTWTATLLVSDTQTTTCRVQVNPLLPVGTIIANTALVADRTGGITETAPVTVVVGPAVFWERSHQKVNQTLANPGQRLAYTLTISNMGNIPASDLVVTDTLDGHVTFEAASAGGVFSDGLVVWSGLTVTEGASIALTLTATVNTPLTDATAIVNQARVVGGGRPPFDLPTDDATTVVYNPALADFSATPTLGPIPLDVTLNDASQHAIDYLWSYGDGLTSTVATTHVHTYADAGVYTVTLCVANPTGADTLTRTRYVTSYHSVVASFTGQPGAGLLPLAVTFTDDSQYSNRGVWNYGDGYTNTITATTHVYTYTSPGLYDVSLTAIGPYDNDTFTRTAYINVYDLPVAAFAASPLSGAVPLRVTFTNTSQHASSFLWDFGDGRTSTASTPTHEYETAGVYTVSLRASNPVGVDWLVHTHYVNAFYDNPAELTVCREGPPTCGYDNVQEAVDAANPGSLIKVAAGVYTGTQGRPAPLGYLGSSVISQMVYISESITIQGGYTTTNDFAEPPDPEANPTVLDAQGDGRVLFISGNVSPMITGLGITGGDATGLRGGEWGGSLGGDSGGGIYIATAMARLAHNTIFDNSSPGCGGGVHLERSDATLEENAVTDNRADEGGGGLLLWYSDAALNDNTVSANYGGTGGGALLWASDATLYDNTFSVNEGGGEGGGLYLLDSDVTFIGNTIVSNTAHYSGGGLYSQSYFVTFISNTVAYNTSILGGLSGGGGGLYLYIFKTATLAGNTFISNTTYTHGGGVFFRGDTAIISNNTFISNTIPDDGHDGWGGGLYLNADDATLSSNTFTANSSIAGGGMYLEESRATLKDNTFVSNSASGYGGGLYLYRSNNVTIEDNAVISNTVGDYGGGLFLNDSDSVVLGNTLISNTAGSRGGGLFLRISDAKLTNNIIAANRVNSASGSGIYLLGSSPQLLHTTLARNTGGDGSGIYVRNSNLALTNSILVSHSVGINVDADSNASLEATLWGAGDWANQTDWSGAGTITTGTLNLWENPAFLNPDAGDYHLAATSAAIDNGLDAGVELDIDGESRPFELGYDIGADEFHPRAALELSKRATPAMAQPGELLTYTLRLANTGNISLSATITDTLPEHVTPGGAVTWTPATLLPGGRWTGLVTVTVDADYTGFLTNVVRATTLQGASGVYTETIATPMPALAVSKRASPAPVQAGTQLTYTLRVTNTGNVGLHATITDTLPIHVTPGGMLTWTPTLTTPGDVWTQTVVVSVELGYVGPLTNVIEVTTAEGVTATDACTVNAEQAVAELIAANDGPTSLGQATTLTAGVTDGSNVVYTWAFGDGEFGSGAVVTHAYPSAGVYTAVVSASNPVSLITATTSVSVDEAIAGLTAFNDGPTPLDQATTLTASINAGSNVVYTWAFGDGEFGHGAVVAHTYPHSGVYTAIVTASNSLGHITATTSVNVDRAIAGLVAFNDGPTLWGQATTLIASANAGSNIVYTWDFGDGESGSGAVVAHTYPSTGIYTAVVTASNSLGHITATTSVDVEQAVAGLAAFNDGPTPLGQTTTLTASVNTGSNVVYTWNLGDGQPGSGAAVTHTYPSAGVYTAVVSASNAINTLTTATTVIITGDGALPSLSINDVSVLEGDSGPVDAVFSVTLSSTSSQPITVQYATVDGSATAPDDYTAISATLAFPPGGTACLITVSVQGDSLDEADENFGVNLSNPVNALLGDAWGDGLILDDDEPSYDLYLPVVVRGYR
jgi:uncharacterized repeat protein (TIGR01451 family)